MIGWWPLPALACFGCKKAILRVLLSPYPGTSDGSVAGVHTSRGSSQLEPERIHLSLVKVVRQKEVYVEQSSCNREQVSPAKSFLVESFLRPCNI